MAGVSDNPTSGGLTVTLWGRRADGQIAGKTNTGFRALPLQPDRSNDIQILFDASRGRAGNVGCRVRRHGDSEWGPVRWLANPVVSLNPAYLSEPKARAVYLGKYSPASTMASDFSVGTVTLTLPVGP